MDMTTSTPMPGGTPTLERIVFRPVGQDPFGWLSALLRHPWGAMLLQEPILCRILALLPLPLLAMPLLHLPGWPCIFHEITGIPCPGCGMTRAILCLLQGEFAQALRHHAMVVPAAGAWLVLAVGAVLPRARRRGFAEILARWERHLAFSGMVLAVFFLFGMGRMAVAIWTRFAPQASEMPACPAACAIRDMAPGASEQAQATDPTASAGAKAAAGNAALATTPAARPANPDASPQSAALLHYLRSLPERTDRRVLAGQNIGHANEDVVAAYAKYFIELRQATDQMPAMLGIDYGYSQLSPQGMASANQLLIQHWNDGGLVTISMSPGNPWTGGGLRERSTGGAAPRDLVTNGTEAYRRWHDQLDNVAAALAQLRDAGVVVLWRPLHEMNGGFFWWSAGSDNGWATPEDFRALWHDLFDYLSREKGLDNLLWVYAPNVQSNDGVKPVLHYYPGDDQVDVVGLDYYENTMDRMDVNGCYRQLVALGKPFAITEVGPAFWWRAHPRGQFDTRIVIDGIRRNYPATTYFVFWHGWQSMLLNVKMGLAENLHARELLDDPWVIPLGKVEMRHSHPRGNPSPQKGK